jgi:hypothetical protein
VARNLYATHPLKSIEDIAIMTTLSDPEQFVANISNVKLWWRPLQSCHNLSYAQAPEHMRLSIHKGRLQRPLTTEIVHKKGISAAG